MASTATRRPPSPSRSSRASAGPSTATISPPARSCPTTRAMAEQAGVNHLTAVRAYRRLAEEGYVTATVGRGTFVRRVPPSAAAAANGTEWQTAVLPEERISYPNEMLAESFRLPADPDVISLATGWPDPELYPVDVLAAITADIFRELRGEALNYVDPVGVADLRAELAKRGRAEGFAESPDEIVITSGARQGLDLVSRAVVSPGDVVAVESPTFVGALSSLQATGARVIGIPVDEDGMDVNALERVLARHEVKLVAVQAACANPTGPRPVGRAPRATGHAGAGAVLLRARRRGLRHRALRGRRAAAPAPVGAQPRRVCRLAVEDDRGRAAARLDRRLRPAAPAAGDAEDRYRHADDRPRAAHRRALSGGGRAREVPRGGPAGLPRAPRRAAREPRAPARRRGVVHAPARRAPRVGAVRRAPGRARPVRRSGAPGGGVHARRRDDARSAPRARRCACPSRSSAPRSSTRAFAAWPPRCARCEGWSARRWWRCPSRLGSSLRPTCPEGLALASAKPTDMEAQTPPPAAPPPRPRRPRATTPSVSTSTIPTVR